MNTTTTVSGVEHINDAGTRKHFSPLDAAPYWTRMITCHGGGKTVTLILHANRKEALDLTPAQGVEAGLAEMDNDTLDALANAIRAERQSRDPQPAPDDAVPAGVTVAEHLAPKYAEIDRHPQDTPAPKTCAYCGETKPDHKTGCWVESSRALPRDCAPVSLPAAGPVTVTEDDGEVPF